MNAAISESLLKCLLVLTGGGAGSMCRYGAALLSIEIFGTRFPYGTMIVNLSGCFLIGICYELAERTSWFGPFSRLFFMTGFLGGLTTFSSFALETVIEQQRDKGFLALANILINNIAGLAMVLAGMWCVYFFNKWKA